MNGMSETELLELATYQPLKLNGSAAVELYGCGAPLRKYGYYPSWLPIYVMSSHGPNQWDYPQNRELNTSYPHMLVYSHRMKLAWERFSSKPCDIIKSPFVVYREDNQINLSDNANGTIAFFSHSTPGIDVSVNIEKYIEQLSALPEHFKPYEICFHFADILNGFHKPFLEKNIACHTAGHWQDPKFISRFYSILRNFKYSTSNAFGSYGFYAAEMGIPFFIHGERPTYNNVSDDSLPYGKLDSHKDHEQLIKVNTLFSDLNGKLSNPQLDVTYDELGVHTGIGRIRTAYILYSSFIKHSLYQVKHYLSQHTPKFIKHLLKWLTNSEYRRIESERVRLAKYPRYKPLKSRLLGKEIAATDSASLWAHYEEIFTNNIYRFSSHAPEPVIIDCGANIGLSVIYFKKLYPKARITAFEPDSTVFECLKNNLESFGFTDVDLINKGLWDEETTLKFYSEGADAGRVALKADQDKLTEVHTVKLSQYLNTAVDFLKIDIEGAETKVLQECSEQLDNVTNIFVEYHSFIGQPQELDLILKILKDAGFRVGLVSGLASPNPNVQSKSYHNMDMTVNIFGYRTPK